MIGRVVYATLGALLDLFVLHLLLRRFAWWQRLLDLVAPRPNRPDRTRTLELERWLEEER